MEEPAPFDRLTWPVHTERLLIRPVTPDDFGRLYEIRAIPEVTQWLTGRPTSYDDYVERYGTPERLASTLVVELGDTIIGDLFASVPRAARRRSAGCSTRRTPATGTRRRPPPRC